MSSEGMIISPTSSLAISPVMNLETAKQRLAEFQEFIKFYMTEGEDYGTIPGTPKPTLYKSGADKLCELYGLADSYKILDKTEDFDRGLFDYNIECQLTSRRDGIPVSSGLGSCNSYEGRYRWRDLQRVCPACGKAAIIKGKAEYGGGWLCFKKKDGCGAKYKTGDAAIEGQETGKVQNEDIATLKNTILKMAKKRAKVDATLAATRSSGVFTQDMDDISPSGGPDPYHEEGRHHEEPEPPQKRIAKGTLIEIGEVKGETLCKLQDGEEFTYCSTTNKDFAKRLNAAHGNYVELAVLSEAKDVGKVKIISNIECIKEPEDLVPALEASIKQVPPTYDDARGLAMGVVQSQTVPTGKAPMKIAVQCGGEVIDFHTFSKTSQKRLTECKGKRLELIYKMGEPFKGKAQREIVEVVKVDNHNFREEENAALSIEEEAFPF